MSAFEITPVNPVIGAELDGVRLGANLSDAVIEEIRQALARYLVLVFKDQDLNAVELRSFTSRFGPLFVHHEDEGVIFSDGVPEVLEMVKDANGERLFGGSDWHADVTFRKPEGLLSVLHAKELPPRGGDTAFANCIAAYSALSSGMQEMLNPLKAVHSYNGRGVADHPTENACHPIVRTHPDSGQRGLYINRMFATRFVDWTCEESEPLIDFLDRHMTRPEFCCRLSWSPGQLVVWDNRFTLHYPINDFTGYRRRLLRCTAMCG